MKSEPVDRRGFLKTSMAVSAAALAGTVLSGKGLGAVTKPEREAYDGLKLGIASYTFRNFTLDQAIDMTQQTGLKYINLKDVHLPLKSSTEQRQEARRKIEAAGLKLMGGGVISMKNDEAQIRGIFDYAKEAGMPVIVCMPVHEALDTVEKMAKQYGILIAIHNHGPGDKNYPSPMDVFKMVRERDPLMGLCMDVGHTVRIGVDPLECIEICGERLHDMHIKDVTEAAPGGKNAEVGRGVIDIVGILKSLAARKFPYHIGLEYEAKADNPMPGVLESVGYMRGVLAAI
jgi:sugar phosphate isomerase/epimerase